MQLRLALYDWAARHRLDAAAQRTLQQLAGLRDEPPAFARWWPRGLAVAAAALMGFGLILWIAANWEELGRVGRFAVLQGVVLAGCVGALWRWPARAPLGLLALLGIGALFAFFGQTYQTGADPWQLFALWAVLALPLALALRSDVLWAPWALVAMTGVSLWVHAHTGHSWRVDPQDLGAYLLGWGAALVLVAMLSPLLATFTGAGPWGLRSAATLAVVLITLSAMGGLFSQKTAPQYMLGLALLALAALACAQRRAFDVYVLSAIAFALDSLIVAGLVRALLRVFDRDPLGPLTLIGLVAAGLLAMSVSLVLRLARRYAIEDAA